MRTVTDPPPQRPVHAKELSGQVVGVTDGDTLTLLDAYNTQYKVRLAGIDAPESAMNWAALADLTFHRQAIVLWDKTDLYGRTLGKVMVDGRMSICNLLIRGWRGITRNTRTTNLLRIAIYIPDRKPKPEPRRKDYGTTLTQFRPGDGDVAVKSVSPRFTAH